MASSAHLLARFCARSLEGDVGLGNTFLARGAPRLAGTLRSSRVPSDFQRHEVGPGGDVLHVVSLGFKDLGLTSSSSFSPSSSSSASGGRSSPRSTTKTHGAGRQATSGPARNDARDPWIATLYSSGQRPDTATKKLALALQVPPIAFRSTGGTLRMPGVSVRTVTLPRGLPSSALHPNSRCSHQLQSGLLVGSDPIVAIGQTVARTIGGQADGASSHRRKDRREVWRCEGHRYTVVIRDLDFRQQQSGLLEERIKCLREDGFVNFFDLADFGFADVRRYEIGAALWAGRWHLASRLLLAANYGAEDPLVGLPAAAFRDGDLARGIDLLPENGAEGLRSLATELLQGTSPHEALQRTVPIPVWANHMSSVARLVWNQAAAARLGDSPRQVRMGDLIWDEKAGEARQLSVNELPERSVADVVLPIPRLGEAVPDFPSRLCMEATLRRLLGGAEVASAEAFPFKVNAWLPAVRQLVGVPADMTWDVVDTESDGPIVDCDLMRLGVLPQVSPCSATAEINGSNMEGYDGSSSGRRSRGLRRGGSAISRRRQALRLRYSLPRGLSGEAALRELLQANPSEFHEGIARQDELF
eukprot:TRINITY_DN17047_c0_g1_i1.p1 TRINITY_DN17047_c0_g1~~TRINITY_DN17047_c0_g1_i1.p1  ORF type:complete len:588 (-),score=102.64 TRINITY_DN17047_c0_g1_i1:299-2062(-)